VTLVVSYFESLILGPVRSVHVGHLCKLATGQKKFCAMPGEPTIYACGLSFDGTFRSVRSGPLISGEVERALAELG